MADANRGARRSARLLAKRENLDEEKKLVDEPPAKVQKKSTGNAIDDEIN